MAINFTDNPSVGNTVTTGNVTYTWNGTNWESSVAVTIDANTLDGVDSTEFAQLTGANFTGAVTVNGAALSTTGKSIAMAMVFG